MKTIPFYFILCVLLLLSCTKTEDDTPPTDCATSLHQTDLQKLGLKGNVKSYRESAYYDHVVADDGTVDETQNPSSDIWVYTFNACADFTRNQTFDRTGKLLQNTEDYLYNEKGLLAELFKETFTTPRYKSGAFGYDAKGFQTSSLIYNPDGAISLKYAYQFDDKGNLIETVVEASNNLFIEKGLKILNTFDANGNLTESLTQNANGVMQAKTVSTYDAGGHPISGKTYDANGNLTLEKTNTYDTKGNVIEETSNMYVQGSITVIKRSYTYVYDSKDNWTKRTSFEYAAPDYTTKKAFKVEKREFAYY